MTRENLFPDPPASLPSDVPCSPCINDSSKTGNEQIKKTINDFIYLVPTSKLTFKLIKLIF